jgi:hypothetical protein
MLNFIENQITLPNITKINEINQKINILYKKKIKITGKRKLKTPTPSMI